MTFHMRRATYNRHAPDTTLLWSSVDCVVSWRSLHVLHVRQAEYLRSFELTESGEPSAVSPGLELRAERIRFLLLFDGCGRADGETAM